MAGKRDEVFLLGEEELGDEPLSAPAEEPTTTAPLPGRSRPRPFRLRFGWPQVLAGALLLAALALLVRPGEEGADRPPSRDAAPAPATVPIVPAPQRPEPEPAPEREPRRSRSPEPRKTSPKKPAPAPVADAASAPEVIYEPASEIAPEAAPEVTTAPPAPASPPPPPRPEFGIER